MGVLDESDIEKISQAFKKRNIPKLFNDPKRGYNAFWWASYVAVMGIFILGAVSIMLYSNLVITFNETKELNEHYDNYISDEVAIKSKMIENADCPTLFRFYNEFNDHGFADIRSQIKDEIAFRCK